MKKTYCDKCGTDFNVKYTLKVDGFPESSGFIFLDVDFVSELHFCGKCITEVSKVMTEFLKKQKTKDSTIKYKSKV